MKIFTAFIIIIGGLLLLYFNFKISFKMNFTITFVVVNMDFIFYKKIFNINRNLYYEVFIRKLLDKYNNNKTIDRYERYWHYRKYMDRFKKYFYIKNINFYPESFRDQSSLALEFNVVNKVLKNSLIN